MKYKPKEAGIKQTRAFLKQNKRIDWSATTIAGKVFSVHPAVFNPGLFPSTEWYTEKVRASVHGQQDFCEVGCGAGVTSCLVALDNPSTHVVATDINPFASENTKRNAHTLGVSDRVEVVTGDVFDGIPQGRTFDSIFWALPFGLLEPSADITMEEMQVFDPGYRSIQKFLNTAKNFLKPNGQLLIGFSSDLGHGDLLEELANESGLTLTLQSEQKLQEKDSLKFELLRGIYQK